MKQNTTFLLRATAAAALLGLCSHAFALDTSANIELDNTYRTGDATKGTADAGLTQSGRVEYNISGKAGSNMFVAGKAALIAKKDGTAATDDMWIQLGNASGDVKLGRFEGMDLFPVPQDTVVNHAGTVYGGNWLRGRKGANVFHAAGTINLAQGLALEIGAIETKVSGEAKGIRPALSYESGPLGIKVGFEAGKIAVTDEKISGFAATGSYDFGGFKLVGDLANGKKELNGASTFKNTSFAIAAQAGSLALGLVAASTDTGTATKEKVTTFYASYSLPLFDIKGASMTPALSVSKAKDAGGVAGATNNDTSLRLRFNYTF
jgi:Porin-like glycoporin RafY